MIKVEIIRYAKHSLSGPDPYETVKQELADFINQVGYENIKQIVFSGSSYTVIYEE